MLPKALSFRVSGAPPASSAVLLGSRFRPTARHVLVSDWPRARIAFFSSKSMSPGPRRAAVEFGTHTLAQQLHVPWPHDLGCHLQSAAYEPAKDSSRRAHLGADAAGRSPWVNLRDCVSHSPQGEQRPQALELGGSDASRWGV